MSRRAVVAAGGVAAFTPAASLLPLDNFTAVHDDLDVRALLVESGSRRIALAVLDLFAGVEPELSASTANTIRENSSFSSTFVMSMFEGGAKNMPDKWNFDHVTYAAVDGFSIEGTAEKAVARIDRIIKWGWWRPPRALPRAIRIRVRIRGAVPAT
ncbi:hypothetical protein [Streptomyces sp. SAS_276]|uniref:hypothetical protein n=1 Tax=Streptomyces sp. SAS_276 TaxID=3412745 RepID=UPI00403CE814